MTRRDWNPQYTLRWNDESGEHTVTGTSRDIHHTASAIHQHGDNRQVREVAVTDETGADVTGRFFNYLDHAAV